MFCDPWVHGEFALIGDAAHAFTPFFGQGCNSGFEDVSILHDLLTKGGGGGGSGGGGSQLAAVLATYYSERKPNADAIANMALENFDEMMSKTADARFLLEKEIEHELATRHPAYISRYVLITHSLFPYPLCQKAGTVKGALAAPEGIAKVEDVDWDRAAALIKEEVLLPRAALRGDLRVALL